jgi:alpha-1,3-fucosyltransferase
MLLGLQFRFMASSLTVSFLNPSASSGQSPLKSILLYNAYWDWKDWRIGFGQESFAQCRVKNCFTTADRNHFAKGGMSKFDAVMIHAFDFHLDDDETFNYVNSWRKAHQRLAYFFLESPGIHPVIYSDRYNHFWNYTMTYRWDSDFPHPYGLVEHSQAMTRWSIPKRPAFWSVEYSGDNFLQKSLPNKGNDFREQAQRPRQVAWVVSKCNTPSRREDYVSELKKYIQVDIFGSCGIACPGDDCWNEIVKEYKFYLSFENSFSNDYVTEKFFTIMNSMLVPVTLGQANYSVIAPPHSFINALDYQNPKALADYLIRLDQNETEYLSYFWWKDYYRVDSNVTRIRQRAFCDLCASLHEDATSSSYSNFEEWFRGDAQIDRALPEFLQSSSDYFEFTNRSIGADDDFAFGKEDFGSSFYSANDFNISDSLRYILFYNSYWDWLDWHFGFGEEPFSNCRVKNCYTTSNRYLLGGNISRFDAVMIHGAEFQLLDYTLEYMENWRKPHQRFVYFMLEPPTFFDSNYYDSRYNNFWNYTVTYRRDSDIFHPYGLILPKNDVHDNLTSLWPVRYNETWFLRETLPQKNSNFLNLAKRPHKIAWVVSRCNSSSLREAYVSELKNYYPVHIMGKCGSPDCENVTDDECWGMISQKHKYYLSFENSFANDYVTEKFFRRMNSSLLPIVLGQANYSQVAPPHSHINVLDFDSPKSLAKYLRQLDRNDSAYLSYFWWKDIYHVEFKSLREQVFCKLCELLQDNTTTSSTYANFDKWWRVKAQVGRLFPQVLEAVSRMDDQPRLTN